MCHTTWRKKISFSQFMTARVKRILPLYWLITCVALIVFIVAPSMVNSGGGVTSIWASYFLAPTGERYLVDNGWTLRYEFFFYLIFGFTLLTNVTHRGLFISSIISILTVVGFIIQPQNSWGSFFLDKLLLEFTMGIAAFHILRLSEIPKTVAVLLLMLGGSALTLQNYVGEITTPLHRVISGGMPMMLIFIGIVRFEKLFMNNKCFLLRFFERLGDSSFSLYLVHPFILSPMAIFTRKLGLVESPVAFTLLLLISSIIAGWLSYQYIEKPLNALIRKRQAPSERKLA